MSERVVSIADGIDAAAEMIRSTLDSGLFDLNRKSTMAVPALVDTYESYQAHAASILAKFQPGEEQAALWAQIELYAAFMEAAVYERQASDEIEGFVLPRSEPIRAWGMGGGQPKYASTPVDTGETLRHRTVPPESASPTDMIWAPILLED